MEATQENGKIRENRKKRGKRNRNKLFPKIKEKKNKKILQLFGLGEREIRILKNIYIINTHIHIIKNIYYFYRRARKKYILNL